MGKYLPIIAPVVAALLILIFGYFYIQFGKNPSTAKLSLSGSSQGPAEVPQNLPDTQRLENLETSVSSLIDQFNSLKSSISGASPQTQTSASVDYRLKTLETTALDLKSRVSALEKASPAPATNKFPLYIPLGTGSTSGDQNWVSILTYQVTLDPADYPGYTNAILEVNMKLAQASGTGYARLYNSTDSSATSSEISTTSDKYSWLSSSTFTLSSGSKTYQLQLKSATGTEISIQNARLKINFK